MSQPESAPTLEEQIEQLRNELSGMRTAVDDAVSGMRTAVDEAVSGMKNAMKTAVDEAVSGMKNAMKAAIAEAENKGRIEGRIEGRKEGKVDGLRLSLLAVREAVTLLRENGRWEINIDAENDEYVIKEKLIVAVYRMGWQDAAKDFNYYEKKAVQTITEFCGVFLR